MSDVARGRYVFGGVLVSALVIGVVLGRPFSGSPTVAGDGTGAVAGTATVELRGSSSSFFIDGHTSSPISPGVAMPLDRALTNSHAVPISVTNPSVAVQEVSAPHADDVHPCAVAGFAVDQVWSHFEITVAAGATRTLSSLRLPRTNWPQVGRLDRSVNPNGCKESSLTLDFTASGRLLS